MAKDYFTTKVCKSCLKEKPTLDFYKIGGGKYTRGECKACLIVKAVAAERSNPNSLAARKKWREHNRGRLAAYLKAWAASNKEKTTAYTKAYQAKNKDKKAAKDAVGNAIRSGALQKQPCWICGKSAEAHHPHYGEPLMVSWLCRNHHRGLHADHAASLR